MEDVLVNSCQRVYDTLGFGLGELVYEKALIIELRSRGIKCENEIDIRLDYIDMNNESHFLTSLRIDIIIKPDIILELKTVETEMKRNSKPYYQVKRYEKLMNAKQCYLINFGKKGLEIYECSGKLFENKIKTDNIPKRTILKIDINNYKENENN